ncbi:MAG: histidine phosphatase family protein [Candidatus Saccharimonadales bacterium]
MTIYFVRHGQTDASTGDAISHDDPLNQKGLNQAEHVANELKNIPFEAIISSPLQRARQTAEAINTYHKLPISLDERLRERDLTTYLSSEAWNEAFDFGDTQQEGVEALDDFFKRVYAALDEFKQKYDSKTILITSHGGVHHALYAYANKLPLRGNVRISRMSYCEYRVYEL